MIFRLSERSLLGRIVDELKRADPVRGLTLTELQHRVGSTRAGVEVAVKRAVQLAAIEHGGHVVKSRPGLQPAKLYRMPNETAGFHVEEEGRAGVPAWRAGRAGDRMAVLMATVDPDRGVTAGEMAELLMLEPRTVRAALKAEPERFVELRTVKRKGVRAAQTYGLASDPRRIARPSRPFGGRPSTLQEVAA